VGAIAYAREKRRNRKNNDMTDKVSELLNFKTEPSNKCTAHSKRTGAPCNNPPVAGLTVCRMHGGATKAAKAAARRRLDEAAERMAKQLLRIADSAESEAVRLAAVKDALDRAGLRPPEKVDGEVGVKPWEAMATKVVGMSRVSREESRRQRGMSRTPALDSGSPAGAGNDHTSARSDDEIVDAEIVDDPASEPAQGCPRRSPGRGTGMRTDDGGGNGPGMGLMTMEEATRLANEANQRAGVYKKYRR